VGQTDQLAAEGIVVGTDVQIGEPGRRWEIIAGGVALADGVEEGALVWASILISGTGW